MNFAVKTPSEQKLEWLEGLGRPLTDEESDQLRRALHAVYATNIARTKRFKVLAMHEREEAALLAKVEAEACQPDRGEWR